MTYIKDVNGNIYVVKKYKSTFQFIEEEPQVKTGYIDLKTNKEICFYSGCAKEYENIEELFDEYVWMNRIIDEETVEEIKRNGSDYSVYGAVWTKGENGEPILKSIAEMNDEKRFDLL